METQLIETVNMELAGFVSLAADPTWLPASWEASDCWDVEEPTVELPVELCEAVVAARLR